MRSVKPHEPSSYKRGQHLRGTSPASLLVVSFDFGIASNCAASTDVYLGAA